jgi:hypothetical protein
MRERNFRSLMLCCTSLEIMEQPESTLFAVLNCEGVSAVGIEWRRDRIPH